jgi:hypothetical protein
MKVTYREVWFIAGIRAGICIGFGVSGNECYVAPHTGAQQDCVIAETAIAVGLNRHKERWLFRHQRYLKRLTLS